MRCQTDARRCTSTRGGEGGTQRKHGVAKRCKKKNICVFNKENMAKMGGKKGGGIPGLKDKLHFKRNFPPFFLSSLEDWKTGRFFPLLVPFFPRLGCVNVN